MIPILNKIPVTQKPVDSPKRSITKTIIWRIIAELDTLIVSYLITGSISWSMSIVGIESIIKTVMYYMHERAWGHVRWGLALPEATVMLCAVSLLLACCAPKADGPTSTAFDGVYHGNGYSASPPDFDCPAVMPSNTLTISGGYATFDDLRGWAAPDRTARLSSREATLEGQFQGLLQYKVRGSTRLGCAYTLKLDRAG
jgi:uncharacterized membrane protein